WDSESAARGDVRDVRFGRIRVWRNDGGRPSLHATVDAAQPDRGILRALRNGGAFLRNHWADHLGADHLAPQSEAGSQAARGPGNFRTRVDAAGDHQLHHSATGFGQTTRVE